MADVIPFAKARKRTHIPGGEQLEELAQRADWIDRISVAVPDALERLANEVRAEALGRGDRRSRDRVAQETLNHLSVVLQAVSAIIYMPRKKPGRKPKSEPDVSA